ncbi:MAG: hypothetical protein ACXVLQ_18985 [Bacteriovorax sp.]
MKNIIALITVMLIMIAQSKADSDIEQRKHHISVFQLKELQTLATSGEVAKGWKRLSEMADSYAAAATEVIRPESEWGVFSSRLVRIHWINAAGVEAYKKNFLSVARQHFRQYVQLLTTGYFPDSKEICISYRKAVTDHGLPPITVFDGAWIRSGFDQLARWEIFSQVPTTRWANSNVFLDVDKNEAREIIETDFTEALTLTIPPLSDGENE